jgi:multisubunit Na+/H+ antiporter MnhG subunit
VNGGRGIKSKGVTLILLLNNLRNPNGTHAMARAAYETGIKPIFNEDNKKKENKA